MQGPYDTMLHGCGGLEEGTSIRVLVEGANYLADTAFTQHLPEALPVSFYLRHAVSVQNTSGAILACGRIDSLFAVDATYRGKTTLSQYTQYLPAMITNEGTNSDILKHIILDGIAGTCSSRAAIFDPWSPPGLQVGTVQTSDQFPVGDLPHHTREAFSFLFEVPVIGSATVLGHAVSSKPYVCVCQLNM